MLVLAAMNGIFGNKILKLEKQKMNTKDERVKMMNEILSGMKVLKLYAWEPSFEEQVLEIREKEIKLMKDTAFIFAGLAVCWTCAPFLV